MNFQKFIDKLPHYPSFATPKTETFIASKTFSIKILQ